MDNGGRSGCNSSATQDTDHAADVSHDTHLASLLSSTKPEDNGFVAQLTEHLNTIFLPGVLPSAEEAEHKEIVRAGMETMFRIMAPHCRLVPFGSTLTGMALRNADVDLCFVNDSRDKTATWSSSKLVREFGWMLKRRVSPMARVDLIARARVPIIKLFMPLRTIIGSQHPLNVGYHFDISFSNTLALENTRLLYTYARIDSSVRTVALFVKLWAKQRLINDSRNGTLNSYAYVLMVLHFLIHVTEPPVLPNLQTLKPVHPPMSWTYFVDNKEDLSKLWHRTNTQPVGELLLGFFAYYTKQFDYDQDVIAIRAPAGLLSQLEMEWTSTHKNTGLYIEDPLDTGYNVSKSSTPYGLEVLREELHRAFELLSPGRNATPHTCIRELLEDPRQLKRYPPQPMVAEAWQSRAISIPLYQQVASYDLPSNAGNQRKKAQIHKRALETYYDSSFPALK